MKYYITQVGRKLINEFKAPSIRGTLAGAQSTASPRIGGSSGKSSVGATKGQDTNWTTPQKKEVGRMMGDYKSRAVGDMEHKFSAGGGEGSWRHEPASLGRHELDAWRKNMFRGEVVPVGSPPKDKTLGGGQPARSRTWMQKNTKTGRQGWHYWHGNQNSPERTQPWQIQFGEKGDPRWPGVTSTDPFGSKTNLDLGMELARRKGSGDNPGRLAYKGPGDTVAPTSRPTPEKKSSPEMDTQSRMAHADKFDPEKQRQQTLARVSNVMKQRKDVKQNINFSDLKPSISSRLRKQFEPDIEGGNRDRADAAERRRTADQWVTNPDGSRQRKRIK